MSTQDPAVALRVEIHEDPDPDLSWLEQDCWNEATDTEPEGYGRRRIASHGDEWWTVGVVVSTRCEHGGEIDVASVWGVEADGTPASIDNLWHEAVDLAADLEVELTAEQASAIRSDLDDESCAVEVTL